MSVKRDQPSMIDKLRYPQVDAAKDAALQAKVPAFHYFIYLSRKSATLG